MSTPSAGIFKSPPEALELYKTYPTDLNESISSLGQEFAHSQILNDLAQARVALATESMSTPAVATDMLNIARAFGQDKVHYWGIS